MPYQWPLDKLTCINSALSQTADNLCNVADDGSDEWNCCSPAYELALGYMVEQHNWLFAKTFATLTPAATAPTDGNYDTAYNLPADCVHVMQVRLNGVPVQYDFQQGPTGGSSMQLVLNQGGAALPVTAQFVSQTNGDPITSSPTFVAALVRFVMAGIYRGLHEDGAEARAQEATAMSLLQQARTRHDQQRPKMVPYNSRITAARRVRRPWPRSPSGWGGSGSLG